MPDHEARVIATVEQAVEQNLKTASDVAAVDAGERLIAAHVAQAQATLAVSLRLELIERALTDA